MKIIAAAVAALAVAVLAHPIVEGSYQQAKSDKVASMCWADTSFRDLKSIIETESLDQIHASIQRDTPESKTTRSDLEKLLSVTIGQPFVSSISVPSKTADCTTKVTLRFRDASASGVMDFTVRPIRDGSKVLMRTSEITKLLGALSDAIQRRKQ